MEGWVDYCAGSDDDALRPRRPLQPRDLRLAPLEQERATQRELDRRAATAVVVRRQQVAFAARRTAPTAATRIVPDYTGEGEVVNSHVKRKKK